MQDKSTTIESRIAKLERKNRLMMFFCFGIPCLAFLLGAGTADVVWQGKKVTAEQFVLTNSDGEVRATLGIREGGGADFGLFDKNGKLRVLLTANGSNNNEDAKKGKDAPSLLLLSRDEKPALNAGLNRDSGIGSVDFLDNGQFKGGVGGSNLHGK